jgi:hypothetical protein
MYFQRLTWQVCGRLSKNLLLITVMILSARKCDILAARKRDIHATRKCDILAARKCDILAARKCDILAARKCDILAARKCDILAARNARTLASRILDFGPLLRLARLMRRATITEVSGTLIDSCSASSPSVYLGNGTEYELPE